MKIVLETNCLIPIIIPSSFGYDIEFIFPSFHFNLIKSDPDDNKFVDCAITAGASYIVSNDKHLAELDLYDFPKIGVCTLAQFLEIVRTL